MSTEKRNYHMQDYQQWGNAIHWTEWPKMRVHGHLSRKPFVGDTLTCDFNSGARRMFTFTKVDWCRDPSDMFFAEVEYCGDIETNNQQTEGE